MVKSTVEKPAKSKLLGATKSKRPAAAADTKAQPPKASTSAAPDTKAEGARKGAAAIGHVDDKDSQKRDVALKGGKRTKGSKHDTESETVQPKVHKRKEKAVDSDEEEDLDEKTSTKAGPKKLALTSKKSRTLESATRSSGTKTKKPSLLSQPPKGPPSPSALDDEDAELDEDKENGFEEKDEHIFGFSTDDEDSSDDEVNDDPDPLEVSRLPTIAKDDAVVKQKLEKAKRKPAADLGVIYLGRIPHGFYEQQMKAYFSQFGDVTRLRLSRNKKTGRSKHYAFIEFDSSAVAQVVAETMDNYLLMGHILTCKLVPKDEVHPELWVGANRKWRAIPTARIARVKHNKPRTEEEQEKAEKRLLKRQSQKKRKLQEAGIKYDFDAVAYKKKLRSSD